MSGRVSPPGPATVNPTAPETLAPGASPAQPAAQGGAAPATTETDRPADNRPVLTDEQIYAVGDELAEDNDFYVQNPLNKYMNVAYHFKLTMVSDTDIMTSGAPTSGTGETGAGGNTQGAGVMAAYDGAQKIILAESGVTAGFNIKDVRMNQIAGLQSDTELNRTAMTGTTIVITEAIGTSFFEKMRNAAAKLRIKNLKECPYYLELSFKGYDEDGNPIDNLMLDEGLGQGGRWIYSIAIQNIEANFDQGGTEYTLTATPYSYMNSDSEFGQVRDMLKIKGRTIGEMLASFEESLNKAIVTRYATAIRTYKFIPKSIPNLGDPSDFPIVTTEPDLNDSTLFSLEEGVPTIQVRQGSIETILNTIYSNSARIQELVKNINKNTDTDVSDTQSTDTGARETWVFKPETEVVTGKYEPLTGRYRAEVKYHIHAYYTQSAIISRQQVEQAKDPATQETFVRRWREKGFLKKRYDYYYTGKNTEVINVDTKFDFKWAAVLPLVYGHRLTNESVSTHARYNEAVTSGRNHVTELNAIRDRIAVAEEKHLTLNRELAEIEDRESQAYIDKQNELTVNSRERTDLYQQATNSAKAIGEARSVAEPASEQDRTVVGNVYAEDLGEISEEDGFMAVTFAQADTSGRVGEGSSAPYHRDRGLFSAILDQLFTRQMLSVAIEIRGDPYWLGQTDLERREVNASDTPPPAGGSTTVNWAQGENAILLTMAFPYSIDEDGAVVMRSTDSGGRKDVFDGFYTIRTIEHIFEGGQFRQVINGQRFQLIEFINANGFRSENQEAYDALNQTNGGGAPGAPGAGGNGRSATGRTSGTASLSYRSILPNASDDDLIARTIYGEARGQSDAEQRAIAHTIFNRMDRKNATGREIVLQPWQYSPWNATAGDTGQRDRLINLSTSDPQYQRALANVRAARSSPDPTGGADHFWTGPDPSWAAGRRTTVIPGFAHRFQNHNGAFPNPPNNP